MLSAVEVAVKLGIKLETKTPGLGCLWDGEKLHTKIATPLYKGDFEETWDAPDHDLLVGHSIQELSEEWLFHELAHVLMCPTTRIKQKDYGFWWNPLDLTVTHYTTNEDGRRVLPSQMPTEHDAEEVAVDLLSYIMMVECGYDVETLVQTMESYNKPEVWKRGQYHPEFLMCWELFLLLMGE